MKWFFQLFQRIWGREKKEKSVLGKKQDLGILSIILVNALYRTYSLLMQQQSHLFSDLGKTVQGRFQLSARLAESLLASGVEGLSAEDLGRYLTVGDLQDILWGFFLNEPIESIQRKLYATLLRKSSSSQSQRQSPVIFLPDQPNYLSEVPATHGTPWTRSYWRRAGRGVERGHHRSAV